MSNPNEEGPASLDVFSSTIWPAVYQPVQCLQEQIRCTIFMRSWLVALVGKQLAAADQIVLENTSRLAGPSSFGLLIRATYSHKQAADEEANCCRVSIF